ncbi:MAG: serine/threonine protein kinase [Planctomycetes bacterium]|nr:serine/threonine protein kinase [Planctomycetota bacterium]
MTPEDEAQFLKLALANRLFAGEAVEACRALQAAAGKPIPLADLLVREGHLSERDRLRIEKTMQAHRMRARKVVFPGEGSRELLFGSAGVHLGRLTPRDLSRALRRIDVAKKEGAHLSIEDSLVQAETLSREGVGEVARFLAGPGAAPGAFPVQKIFAQFEILHPLSQGAMGAVYRARDLELDKVVALKILSLGKEADERALERFSQEMKALGAIDHPLLVSIHTSGEYRGWQYYSMDYVEGPALSAYLAERGNLEVDEAMVLVRELCRSVGALHEGGFLHRDIKPSNVILDRRRLVKRDARTPTGTTTTATPLTPSGASDEDGIPAPILIDFGIVQAIGEKPAAPASPGESPALLGTPEYMAPEQIAGEGATLDRRCDVYSLGTLLYELLTGSSPFAAEDPLAVITRALQEDPDPPSTRRPGLDPEVDAIVGKAIRRDRNERYVTTSQFLSDIDRYLKGQEIEAPILRAPVASLKTLWALGAAVLGGIVLFFGLSYLGYRRVDLSIDQENEEKRAGELGEWKEETLARFRREAEARRAAGRSGAARRLDDAILAVEGEDAAARARRKEATESIERLRREGPDRIRAARKKGDLAEAARRTGELAAYFPGDPEVATLLRELPGEATVSLAGAPPGLVALLFPEDASESPGLPVAFLASGGPAAGLAPGRYRLRAGGMGALLYDVPLEVERGPRLEIELLRIEGPETPSATAFLPETARSGHRLRVEGGAVLALRETTHEDLARFRWMSAATRPRAVLLSGPALDPARVSAEEAGACARWLQMRPVPPSTVERALAELGLVPTFLEPPGEGLRLAASPEDARFAAAKAREVGAEWRRAVENSGGEPLFLEPGPLLAALIRGVRTRLPGGTRSELGGAYLAASFLEVSLLLATEQSVEYGAAHGDLSAWLEEPSRAPRESETLVLLVRTLLRLAGHLMALSGPDPGAAGAELREDAAKVDPEGGREALVAASDLVRRSAARVLSARAPGRAAADLEWSELRVSTEDVLVGASPEKQAASRLFAALELLWLATPGGEGRERRDGFEIAGDTGLKHQTVFGQIAGALAALAELAAGKG